MKIRLEDINSPKTIILNGLEPWLDGIYQSFPYPPDQSKPLITGELRLRNLADGMSIDVQGTLSYQPFVDCSRCGIPITWAIAADFHARFIPPARQDPEPGERDEILTEAKAECYEIDLDHSINLEPLINDRIQVEIPLQTVKKSEDLQDCQVCGKSVADDRVYAESSGNTAKENPFAALKDLKVKH